MTTLALSRKDYRDSRHSNLNSSTRTNPVGILPSRATTVITVEPEGVSRHYLTMVDFNLTTHSFGSRKVLNMSEEKELNWAGPLFAFAMSLLFWVGLISLIW